MRGIKFRAWDKGTNWMCFVDAIYQPLDNVHQKFDLHVINSDKKIRGARLDEIVLMQYTGLKDKNGVEIYEGDIVSEEAWGFNKDGEGRVGEISIEASRGVVLGGTSPLWTRSCEVIGNIYENPAIKLVM